MATNAWGTVAGVSQALPMATLLGATKQLMGMNTLATLVEYKTATFDNATGQMGVPDGSAGTPSYSFGSAPTYGIFFRGGNTVGISIAGTERVTVTNTGINNTAIGATTPSTVAASSFSSASDITVTNGVFRGNTTGTLGMSLTKTGGDIARFFVNAAGGGAGLDAVNNAGADFTPYSISGNGIVLNSRTGVASLVPVAVFTAGSAAITGVITNNSNVGLGAGATSPDVGLLASFSGLTSGVTQIGSDVILTGSSSGTVSIEGSRSQARTVAAAFTCAELIGVRVVDGIKGGGSSISIQEGFKVEDLTVGTNNYGFRGAVTSGANKWNLFMDGNAANHLKGITLINTTDPSGGHSAGAGAFSMVIDGSGTNNFALLAKNNNGAASPALAVWNALTTGDDQFIQFYTETGTGTLRGSIDYNRGGGAVRYNTTSDERLKNLIALSDSTTHGLKDIEIWDYEWDFMPGTIQRGVIAQKLFKTNPDAVSKPGGIFGTWGADPSKLVPNLILGWKDHESRFVALKAAFDSYVASHP